MGSLIDLLYDNDCTHLSFVERTKRYFHTVDWCIVQLIRACIDYWAWVPSNGHVRVQHEKRTKWIFHYSAAAQDGTPELSVVLFALPTSADSTTAELVVSSCALLGMLLEASLARVRRKMPGFSKKPPASPVVAPTVPPLACKAPLAAKRVPTSEEIKTRRRARRNASNAAVHVPRLSRPSRIVSSGAELGEVLSQAPARFRNRDLQCVYSSADDGVSLQTLYARVAGADPVVLLVRDAGGATFGAFTAVPLREHRAGYYGSGEAFVFAVRPRVAVYPWTRANSFFQLGSSDSIAFGGGGAFALFLDSMLEHGSSGASDTFGNKCLASDGSFEVVVVEAYKLLLVPARVSKEH